MRRGMHHLGFSTMNYERCVDFYTRVLGFEIAWQDLHCAEDGTVLIRHVFFDTGDNTYLAFMAQTPESGAPETWKGDINSGLGLMAYSYHAALWLDSLEELEAMRRRIEEQGVDVTEVVDHEVFHSIYFRDPDGLNLEYAVQARPFNDDDKLLKPRFQPTFSQFKDDPERAARFEKVMGFTADQATRQVEFTRPENAGV